MTREPDPAKIGERHEFPKAGGSCRYSKDEAQRIARTGCSGLRGRKRVWPGIVSMRRKHATIDFLW